MVGRRNSTPQPHSGIIASNIAKLPELSRKEFEGRE